MAKIYREEIVSVSIDRQIDGRDEPPSPTFRAVLVVKHVGLWDDVAETWVAKSEHREMFDIGRAAEITDLIAGIQADLLSTHTDAVTQKEAAIAAAQAKAEEVASTKEELRTTANLLNTVVQEYAAYKAAKEAEVQAAVEDANAAIVQANVLAANARAVLEGKEAEVSDEPSNPVLNALSFGLFGK